jgi:hypothetical protein
MFCEDRPLEGIIAFLSREAGGNVHDLGIVKVSASSQEWSAAGPALVVDFNSSSSAFATQDAANSWICIDFKTRCITPTHYSIRGRTDYDRNQPRSWVLEGSNDCEKWTVLDTRQNNQKLAGLGSVATFSVANPCRVRSIRIRQTGSSNDGCQYLILKSLEFFGSILAGDTSA